jgi:dihydroorotase
MPSRRSFVACTACGLLAIIANYVSAQDLVILNGRVMDPETGLDAIRHIVVENGRITSVSEDVPEATTTIDASGLVVAPGFIDLHAHGQDLPSNRFQAADGVTTALELEIGTWPVARYLDERRGNALINYGATVSHVIARHAAVEGHEDVSGDLRAYFQAAFGTESARRAVTADELAYTLELLREGMRQGALGFGFGITYTPGATHEEIFRAFAAAAESEAPVFVHIRNSTRMGGDRLAPIQEVISNAFATGASLHIVHLNSSTDESARAALELIRSSRQAGLDVTTESYPYTAGSTLIESALFDNWPGAYENLQWAATGERLTEETFQAYRKQGGPVIIHGRSEETNAWLVAQPDVIVASDGISFAAGPAHPRGAGTYARILGHYVREAKALDLMTALAKMTLLPAQRLESIAPQMKRKGRVQVGADADLTIFNPDVIIDKATYTDSMQFSAGIQHVLVGGVPVVKDGALVDGVFPGTPIYGRLME